MKKVLRSLFTEKRGSKKRKGSCSSLRKGGKRRRRERKTLFREPKVGEEVEGTKTRFSSICEKKGGKNESREP